MRKVWSKWTVMVAASLVICLSSIQVSQAQGSVSLQVFYDELQPYGNWINHNNYGYVWSPNVDPGFTPYGSNGYWVNTAYGNTWVSDYSWGWAPFHYGRWFYDDFYGWLWVPDTTWAPAWVAWRSGGGYYGWAPLMPGFGISVSVGYYNRIPHNYWSFVPCRYVMYRNVYRHCVTRPHVVNVINHTTIVNNYNYGNGRDNGRNGRDRSDRSYFTGPSRSEIEQRNRERVPVYEVNDRTRPGRTEVNRTSVSMYKPAVDNSENSRLRSMPTNISRGNENGRTTVIERQRDNNTMPRDMRSEQLRERSNDNADRLQRTMPAERNDEVSRTFNEQRRSTEVDRLQRGQTRDNDIQRQGIENMRREQSEQRLERQQQMQRMNSERSQFQRQPVERSNSQNMQRAPQRDMNSQMRQQPQQQRTQTFERRNSNQVQRAPQIQRGTSGMRTNSPARQSESRGSSRRGIH